MTIDDKLAEVNSKLKSLSQADFSIQNEIDRVISGSDDLDGFKTFSIRLPIKDYATIKILSDDLKQSPSTLARSLFSIILSHAVSRHLEKNPDSDFGERHMELCTDLHVDQVTR